MRVGQEQGKLVGVGYKSWMWGCESARSGAWEAYEMAMRGPTSTIILRQRVFDSSEQHFYNFVREQRVSLLLSPIKPGH
jgi:hypothetical protein